MRRNNDKETIVTNATKHKATIVRYSFLLFRRIGEYISLDLFYFQSKLSSPRKAAVSVPVQLMADQLI